MDEFFQTLDPKFPTISAFLAAQGPSVAAVRVPNVWYKYCPNPSRPNPGLVTQVSQQRDTESNVLRSKVLIRPDKVRAMIIHMPWKVEKHFKVVIADPETEIRMNHYKLNRLCKHSQLVTDTSMSAVGPALSAEIRKAYPDGVPKPIK